MEKNKVLIKIEDILKKHLPKEEADEALSILSKVRDDGYKGAEGFSIVDHPDQDFEEDDAAKWLKEQGAKSEGKPIKSESKLSYYTKPWEAPSNLTPEQEKAVKELMNQGFSEREAHREVGSHKEHQDLGRALKSGIAPSMMSDKHINRMKPLVKEWLENAERHERLHADAEKNPMKHASGQMIRAHEAAYGDYNKAYQDFLESNAVKNLSGRARHQAIRQWKEDWKTKNPEYHDKLEEVSRSQKVFGESRQAAKQNLEDRMKHIMMGGISMPSEISAQEAAQHVGAAKGEEGYVANIAEDPSASFARQNPKLVSALTDEMKDRMKRVDFAAKAQGIVRRKPGGQQ